MTYEQAMRDIAEMLPLMEADERLAAIRVRLAEVEAQRRTLSEEVGRLSDEANRLEERAEAAEARLKSYEDGQMCCPRAEAAEAEVERLRALLDENEVETRRILGERSAAEAALARCREVLRSVEWLRDEDLDLACPVCHSLSGEHKPDCALKAALSGEP